MVQKKIGIILLLIVLLPALFYTAYELNSLTENEKLIDEIYQQQMNTLLYSVNQHAWDVSSRWADQISLLLGQPEYESLHEIRIFLNINNSINTIFIADTTTSFLKSITSTNQHDNRIEILNFLRSKQPVIEKLLYRKQVGYTKIESFTMNSDSATEAQKLLLLFISETPTGEKFVVGIILNSELFIQNILVPKLNEVTRSEFIAGIFQWESPTPVFSTEELRSDQVKIKRNIWLFPEHYLGIRLRGTTIEDLTRDRFYRSLQLIIILDIVLIIGGVIVYRNIRREMELARMKSDFVSNVSHQLRTPLALIRMFVETLELNRIRSKEQKQEYYTIIGKETERLTHLINNILDFSKMETGKKQYHFERCDLNEIVQYTLDFYKFHLQSKGFELKTDITLTNLYFRADREAIAEALINLLDNAIKYSTHQKCITIKTGIENNMVYVDIEDRGIGIPKKEQKYIFDKFYRVSSGLVQQAKGSGLGLTLVKYIVEAHKGMIKVMSTVGKGSCFRLLFPAVI